MSEAKIVLTAVDQTKAAFDSAKQGLQGLHVSATAVKGTLAGLGVTAAAVTFANIVGSAIDAADHLNKLSQRTGIAVERLSELQFAAKLSDVSADSLGTAMKKLNLSIAEGLAGDKEKIQAFKNLGISLRDANGNAITADKALLQMATTFSKADDGATKASYAVALMGKSGDEMIPFLNGGAKSIDDLTTKARRMGLTISGDFAKQAEEFNDNLTIIKTSSDKAAISLAGDLVVGLGKAAKAAQEAAVESGKFSAIIAGIQTLITGDDAHKTNEQIVLLTDQILAATNRLDRARREGDTATMARMKTLIAGLEKQLGLYRSIANENEKQTAPPPAKTTPLPPLPKATNTISEYRKLNEELTKTNQLVDQQLKWGSKLADSRKFEIEQLAKIDQALNRNEISIKEAIELEEKLHEIVEKKQQVELNDSEFEHAMDIARERQRQRNEEYKQAADATREQMELDNQRTKVAKDYLDQVEFEVQLLGMDNTQREVAIAMRELEKQGIRQGTLQWEEYNQKIRDAIALRGNLQQAMEQFQSVWQSADAMAHDFFVNIFEDGSNAFRNLGRAFKRLLLDELYKATLRPFVLNIVASMTGMPAGAAGLGSAGGTNIFGSMLAGSQLGQFLGVAGAGAGIATLGGSLLGYKPNQQIAAAIGGALFGGIPGLIIGGLIKPGGGPKQISGVGMQDGLGGSKGGIAGDPSGAQQIVDSIRQSYSSLGAALGLSAQQITQTLSNLRAFYAVDPQGTAKTQLEIAGGNYSRASMYGGQFENVGRSEGELKQAIALASAQLVLKNLQEQTSGPVGDYLRSIDVATASLEAMNAALKVAADVGALNQALGALGSTFSMVGALSVDNKDALIEQFGGVQDLIAGMAAFSDKFLSAEEKQAIVQQQLTDAFQRAGVVMPNSVDAYREAVMEAQRHLDSAEGRNTFATLIQNADAFYQAAQTTGEGVEELTQQVGDHMDSLRLEAARLSIELMRLQGRDELADIAQRNIDTEGFTDQELWYYDNNRGIQQEIDALNAAAQAERDAAAAAAEIATQRAGMETQILQLEGNTAEIRERELAALDETLRPLQQRIYDLQDEAAAQEAANRAAEQEAARLQAIATERANLETRLLQLQGDTAALRERELQALDPGNREIQQRIYALEDEQKAAAEAAAAIAEAAATAKRIADERYGLETRLLTLQGDTAELRRRELEQLDPSNRELQERIWALEDAREAEQKRTAALKEAAAAAQRQKEVWHSLAENIMQEADRIHGELVGPTSIAAAQANLAILQAQARAGNQQAAQRLVGASQQFDQLAANRARSATELALLRASTAFDLRQTGSIIDSAYGTSSNAPVVDELRVLNRRMATVEDAMKKVAKETADAAEHLRSVRANMGQLADRGVYVLPDPGGEVIQTEAA